MSANINTTLRNNIYLESLKYIKSEIEKNEEESKAFKKLKNIYPHHPKENNESILSFHELDSSNDIIKYVQELDLYIEKEDATTYSEDVDRYVCNCRGSNGDIKKSYSSREEAEQARKYHNKIQHYSLDIYSCPKSNVWHLTKSKSY